MPRASHHGGRPRPVMQAFFDQPNFAPPTTRSVCTLRGPPLWSVHDLLPRCGRECSGVGGPTVRRASVGGPGSRGQSHHGLPDGRLSTRHRHRWEDATTQPNAEPPQDSNEQTAGPQALLPRRGRRSYKRQGIILHPPKLVPLDLEHERQALAALTELLRILLERRPTPSE